MRRLLTGFLAAVMLLTLSACGNVKSSMGDSAATATRNPDCRVAMITDSGDITDQSYNQVIYEACRSFCEENGISLQYYRPTGGSTPERIAMIDAAVMDGYNIVVLPGSAFAGSIMEVQNVYPDITFIVLDVTADDILSAAEGETYAWNPEAYDISDYLSENVTCIVFQEALCGYMAGYAAVRLGYEHLGCFNDMEVPSVLRFVYGFVQGCDDAAVDLGIADLVVIEHAFGNQSRGDADITAYLDNWYRNMGVQCVFACGDIYTSVAEAAAMTEGAKVIGAHVDQSGILNRYCADMTVTSAMKGLSAAVKDILAERVLSRNWAMYGGRIVLLGLTSGTDVEANYVQLPYWTTQWSDEFTQDDYVALVARLYDGSVQVSDDTAAMPEVEITVNQYGIVK